MNNSLSAEGFSKSGSQKLVDLFKELGLVGMAAVRKLFIVFSPVVLYKAQFVVFIMLNGIYGQFKKRCTLFACYFTDINSILDVPVSTLVTINISNFDCCRKVKLFRSYKKVVPKGGITIVRRTIFLNNNFAKLPFYLISKRLDTKLGGTAYRLENLGMNGSTANVIWEFEKKLEQKEKTKIARFIKAVKG